MNRLRWMLAYAGTAGLGLILALLVTSSLLSKSRAEDPPAPAPAPAPTVSAPPAVPEKTAAAPVGPPATGPTQPAVTPNSPPAEAGAAPVAAGTSAAIEEYVYEANGRRDPFKPFRAIRTDKKTLISPADIDPLQRYDLDQLTVLGILWDVRQPRALVKDSDGGIHTLVKNTKVGHNNGYVAAIREGEVVVIESYEEEGGATMQRPRVLELKK